MGKVHVKNRANAVKFAEEYQGKLEIISISDAGDKDVAQFPDRHAVYRFAFNDFEFKGQLKQRDSGLFVAETCGDVQNSGPSEEIAEDIAGLVQWLGAADILVHCEHGQSRSAAVGLFIKHTLGYEFICDSTRPSPNMLLCQMLDTGVDLNGRLIESAKELVQRAVEKEARENDFQDFMEALQ